MILEMVCAAAAIACAIVFRLVLISWLTAHVQGERVNGVGYVAIYLNLAYAAGLGRYLYSEYGSAVLGIYEPVMKAWRWLETYRWGVERGGVVVAIIAFLAIIYCCRHGLQVAVVVGRV